MVRPTSPKTIVSRLFSTSPRPIYLLDGSKRIVYHNAALTDWLGVTDRELVGLKCIYALANSPTDNTNALGRLLAVPPQISESSELRTTIEAQGPTQGNQLRRQATFYSLNDDDDSTLVVVSDTEEALPASEPAFDSSALHAKVVALRKEWSRDFRLDALIGDSPSMRQIASQVRLAAETESRVVVVGAAGSGREAVARTIHRERTAGKGPLIPIDCSLLDAEALQATIESLVRQMTESDMDATSTLLLLDVQLLTLEAQATLLGFLEINELGFCTLATSQSELAELVAAGEFRNELACHLSNLEIRVPSLTDRLEDVPALAQWFLEKSQHGNRLGGFTPEAMEALLRYRFPRETTELKQIVEEAAVAAKGSQIGLSDLPKKIGYAAEAYSLPDVVSEDVNLDEFLADVERELISRALRNAKGNRAQAARSLGVSRGKLLRRIEQLGIEA